ncbi:MAG: helix-turn-helix domain-containing protein [Legionella sp.]
MIKCDVVKEFAYRLRESLIAAGYGSPRSLTGVDIAKVAKLIGHSPQICRKYLRGQVLPEIANLVEISTKLNVSPSWLLFGNDEAKQNSKKIVIDKELLHYIFLQAQGLYGIQYRSEEVPDFLFDLVCDLSQIYASEEQAKKIIDLALASARRFYYPQGRNKV